ncbi:hypothetical protein SOVF_094040, partial [Spinacia oleracea]
MPRHTRRKLAESSVVRAAEEDASDDEAAAINAPNGGMVPRDAPTFSGTGWSPSDLVFRPEWHLSQRPRAGMIWIYEHFPTLAPDRTRDAAYPYAASWIAAVRSSVPLAASRKAWRVLPADERPFANALIPASADRAHFLSGRRVLLLGVYRHMWYLGERVSRQHHSGEGLIPKDPPGSMLALDEELARLYAEARGDAVCRSWRDFVHRKGSYDDFLRRLAPPIRFVLPEEEVDPEDIPHADRILRYENSDGEEVVETIPFASPPHRKSYDVVPKHYAAVPRGSGAGAHQRHSDVERGASPFVHVDPTRHSFGGAGSSRPFVSSPGYYFGGSGPQPWGADSWAYYVEMERMRQAKMFGSYQYMPMPPPYQYSSPQQGVHPSTGTLRISEQDPSTPGTELDQEMERLRRRSRDKAPVVDITAGDESD